MHTPEAFDLQGHRGARGLLPENSIPAFIRALELGVTTLEMDAVISKDSQVVVSHEPWFSEVICSLPSGEPIPEGREEEYRIFEMNYEEVARFDCGSREHPRFPRQEKRKVSKPLLRDVIEMVEQYVADHDLPPVYYNIETKSRPDWDGTFTPAPDVFVRLLYDVLVETGIKERTTIQSFDPRTLKVAHEIDPGLRLSLLIESDEEPDLSEYLAVLGFVPDILSPDYHLVDPKLLQEAHERGMKVIPWTVNTLDEMQTLKEMGVDGIITDYPDIGRELLGR